MTRDRELTMLIVGDVFVRRDDPPSVFQCSQQFGTRFQPMGDAIRIDTDAARSEAAA